MQGESALQVVAEVSVALAGFTGVVAAFGSRSQQRWTPLDVMRFRVMLGTSLAALLFSLVPIALHHLGIAEPATWAVSSTLLLVFISVNMVLDVRTSRTPGVVEDPDFNPWYVRVVGVLMFIAIALQVMNVAGIGYSREFGPYFAGLLLLVGLSVSMFFRLLSFVGRT